MLFSYKLGFGGLENPGPGVFPFFTGVLLFLTSIYFLINSIFGIDGRVETEKHGQKSFGKICFVLAPFFLYVLLLEVLGYMVSSFLFLVILFHTMGSRWKYTLFISLLTTLLTYFLFNYLGVTFPEGVFK
jgi:putative tricarboxylic transport membrane protein